MPEHRYTNALIHTDSPYLQQHAHNPVDWMPWSDKALDKAQREDKLLLISIGYAACHWCHVMEQESFEHEAVAQLMNNHFVSIKVDREERPDIDNLYMQAATLITGRGGWPLNAIALPDGRPIYAGTYFPRDKWMEVLRYFSALYQKERATLEEQAEKISEGIRTIDNVPDITSNPQFAPDLPNTIFNNWHSRIDFTWGGRNGAPKFPMPDNWMYLLAYHHFYGVPQAKSAVEVTLTKMAQGGIFDHLNGGFARYSVDGLWKVPHFEKMLYDNGQLLSLYSHAYAAEKNPLYQQVVAKTIDFVVTHWRNAHGGYCASFDADSDGEEGKYYIWTTRQIRAIVGDAAPLVETYFNLTDSGNFEAGKNVLFVTSSLESVAGQLGLSSEEATAQLDNALDAMRKVQSQRTMPALDHKVLASWNALLLQGLVDAYNTFGKGHYLHLALENARFLKDNLWHEDGRLDRNYTKGKSAINAFLDDYVLLARAYISLYQATFDEEWLHAAHQLVIYVQEHFDDPNHVLFFYTADLDHALVVRQKEISDNVIPASNSVMAEVLWLLGHLLGRQEYVDRSARMVAAVKDQIQQQPPFFSRWAKVLLHHIHAPIEVAIVGPGALDVRWEMARVYAPDVLWLGSLEESALPLLQGKYTTGETRIYVCYDKVCRQPVTTVAAAWKEIERIRRKNFVNPAP